MRKSSILLLVVAAIIALSSCWRCKSTVKNRYPLTEEEKALIPYTQGESLTLSFNGAKDFTLEVTEVYTRYETIFLCEECCDNDEAEKRQATLFCGYPELSIVASVMSQQWNDMVSPSHGVDLTINHKHFFPQMSPQGDSLFTFLCDTTLHGFSYEDVIVLTQYQGEMQDSTIIQYENVVWSKDHGLELITLNNGDYYVRK
ncbi:MAG: hypothetical protein CSA04_02685 [Bacteroidetes bacterium]|nr:MAG: hypothetical protein CSA04_02685 [Bacteroidota bacterium]